MILYENLSVILLADRIKQLRLSKGMTQKEFADSLGIVQGYLSGLERGKKMPSHTLLVALCYVHGVNEKWLLEGVGDPHGGVPQYRASSLTSDTVRIPLLKRIPDGFPGKISEEDISDYVVLPDTQAGCYAILADGDFMAPTIRGGDLVIFKPGRETRNRSIVLINNKWNEVILRRVRVSGREFFFSAENTSYAPFYPDPNTKIFGTVVDVWRNVRI